MDEQNLETKETNTPESMALLPDAPLLPPQPQKKVFWLVFVFLLAAALIIILGMAAMLFWPAKKATAPAKPSAPAAAQQSTSTQEEADLKSQTNKVGGGIVQPAAGFPNDLLIEPLAKPIINESATSTDGKTVTAERSYISAYPMDVAYAISKSYLSGKSWQTTELTAKDPTQEKSFEAQKFGYDAVLIFGVGDGKHALVTITVTSVTK